MSRVSEGGSAPRLRIRDPQGAGPRRITSLCLRLPPCRASTYSLFQRSLLILLRMMQISLDRRCREPHSVPCHFLSRIESGHRKTLTRRGIGFGDRGLPVVGRPEFKMVDPRAELFTSVYAEHHEAIRGYFLHRIRDSTSADELTSVTFEFAWRRIEELPAEPATRMWLYGVARRTLSNYWRSSSRQRNLITKLSSSIGDPRVQDSVSDIGEIALEAMQLLREREREALRLVYWDGLPHSEAAEVLGCSLNAFDIVLHRARRRMLTALNGRCL